MRNQQVDICPFLRYKGRAFSIHGQSLVVGIIPLNLLIYSEWLMDVLLFNQIIKQRVHNETRHRTNSRLS